MLVAHLGWFAFSRVERIRLQGRWYLGSVRVFFPIFLFPFCGVSATPVAETPQKGRGKWKGSSRIVRRFHLYATLFAGGGGMAGCVQFWWETRRILEASEGILNAKFSILNRRVCMWLSNRELTFSFLNNLFACTKWDGCFLRVILKENFKARKKRFE